MSEKSIGSIALVTVNLSASGGGVVTPMHAIAKGINMRGGKAHLYGVGAVTDCGAVTGDAPVHLFKPTWQNKFAFTPELDKALQSRHHDLLHLHGLWLYSSIACYRWGQRTKRPVVISPHGMLEAWALKLSRLKKRIALAVFEQQNIGAASCLHALNAEEAASIRAIGFRGPLAIIPNGVNLPEEASEDFHDKLAGEPRKRLLFLGRIHPKKGVLETVESWALALRKQPALAAEWVLVIAGWDDGSHLHKVKTLVASLSLSEHVVFTGPLFGPDKKSEFNRASAFILASHSEGMPLAVLEAWAHRKPVFMTSACNLKDGFSQQAAIEIPTKPAELAPILVKWLNDPRLPDMGTRGRALVEDRFTWERVVTDMTSVYHWLISGGPPPTCVVLE